MDREDDLREKIREILLGYFGTDKSIIYANLENKIIEHEKELIREIMMELLKTSTLRYSVEYKIFVSVKDDINKLLSERGIKEI